MEGHLAYIGTIADDGRDRVLRPVYGIARETEPVE